MTAVNVGSFVLRLALFGGGLAVALMLRRRDPRAALLTALGFGCVLLSQLIAVGEVLLGSRIVGAAGAQLTFLFFGIVFRLVELAGLVLILLGLLRVVRRRGPGAPWMGAGR